MGFTSILCITMSYANYMLRVTKCLEGAWSDPLCCELMTHVGWLGHWHRRTRNVCWDENHEINKEKIHFNEREATHSGLNSRFPFSVSCQKRTCVLKCAGNKSKCNPTIICATRWTFSTKNVNKKLKKNQSKTERIKSLYLIFVYSTTNKPFTGGKCLTKRIVCGSVYPISISVD